MSGETAAALPIKEASASLLNPNLESLQKTNLVLESNLNCLFRVETEGELIDIDGFGFFFSKGQPTHKNVLICLKNILCFIHITLLTDTSQYEIPIIGFYK